MIYANNIKNEKYYLIFEFFWLIVLLPKSIQLIVLFAISVYLVNFRFRLKIDEFANLQFFGLLIYTLSIVVNIFLSEHELSRVLATFNTFLITFVAIQLYIVYSKADLDNKKIGKCFLVNMAVLLFFLGIYLFFPNSNSLTIMGYSLSVVDNFEGYSTRFVGFFSYANLVPLFSIVSIPFIMEYVGEKKRIYSFVILLLNFVFSYFANSRSGQLIMLFIIFAYAYDFVKSKIKLKNRVLYKLLVAFLIGIAILVTSSYIIAKFQDIFLSRVASNSMRFTLYEKSIKRMVDNNPIIGMGIKDLYADSIYPYGSHSSYIGYFYKTGILGGIVFLASIGVYVIKEIRWKKQELSDYTYVICSLGLFLWMVLEDLDGANWSICFSYILLGIIRKRIATTKVKQIV